jgi:hypothetical protein
VGEEIGLPSPSAFSVNMDLGLGPVLSSAAIRLLMRTTTIGMGSKSLARDAA